MTRSSPLFLLLGVALVLMLWIIAVMALVALINPILAVVALIWGLIVPILGITQYQLLPGSLHWIIQTLHLLVGIIGRATGAHDDPRQQVSERDRQGLVANAGFAADS